MFELPTKLLSAKYVDQAVGAKFGYSTNVGASTNRTFVIGSESKYSGYGPFQCCGSQVVHGLGGIFKDEQQKQDLLTLWLRTKGDYLSWYFIAATYQFEENKENVLNWLMDLGAKEVDKRPNKYHDPHQMHLCVLDITPENENLKKYVTCLGDDKIQKPGMFRHQPKIWVPNWWTKLDDEKQNSWLDNRNKQLEAIEKAEAEQEAKRKEAILTQRGWDFAFGQERPGSHTYVDLPALAKSLKAYGEKRLIDTLSTKFKAFLEEVENVK